MAEGAGLFVSVKTMFTRPLFDGMGQILEGAREPMLDQVEAIPGFAQAICDALFNSAKLRRAHIGSFAR